MMIQRRNQRPKQLGNRRSHQVPVRSLDRPSIIKQVEGVLNSRRPAVEFGLNVGALLWVGNLILDEVPELERERVSGIVQVRRTSSEKIADALRFELLRNLSFKFSAKIGSNSHLPLRLTTEFTVGKRCQDDFLDARKES